MARNPLTLLLGVVEPIPVFGKIRILTITLFMFSCTSETTIYAEHASYSSSNPCSKYSDAPDCPMVRPTYCLLGGSLSPCSPPMVKIHSAENIQDIKDLFQTLHQPLYFETSAGHTILEVTVTRSAESDNVEIDAYYERVGLPLSPAEFLAESKKAFSLIESVIQSYSSDSVSISACPKGGGRCQTCYIERVDSQWPQIFECN